MLLTPQHRRSSRISAKKSTSVLKSSKTKPTNNKTANKQFKKLNIKTIQ